jgi:hypothetical protein
MHEDNLRRLAAAAIVVLASAIPRPLAQETGLREYVDPARRFRFSYPDDFGVPARGTNDGFGDRAAAIRFEVFSSGVGGEAALTRGRAVVDLQTAGGLHDAITLEIFPEPVLRLILQAVPPLTASTFCDAIAREQHVDVQGSAFVPLSDEQRAIVARVDRMRNVNPRVLSCALDRGTVTFNKEVAFQPGGPRQHVYGAVRFLDPPYSTFQIVRAGPPPPSTLLDQMTALVMSWSQL